MSEILCLNKNTLEEKYFESGSVIRGIDWVQVPEGATFATGDKGNLVFRKDGWYYDNQKDEWIETNVLLKHFPEYKHIKLFWVKSDTKKNSFTLERLLGCEVAFENDFVLSKGYVSSVDNGFYVTIGIGVIVNVKEMSPLTFFTEDGDELTFDEYVNMYYGDNCV